MKLRKLRKSRSRSVWCQAASIAVLLAGVIFIAACGTETSTVTSPAEPMAPESADYCPPKNQGWDRILDVSTLVGMDEEEAKKVAEEYECELFVVFRDGEHVGTPLLSNIVIEAHVVDGKVTVAGTQAALHKKSK